MDYMSLCDEADDLSDIAFTFMSVLKVLDLIHSLTPHQKKIKHIEILVPKVDS